MRESLRNQSVPASRGASVHVPELQAVTTGGQKQLAGSDGPHEPRRSTSVSSYCFSAEPAMASFAQPHGAHTLPLKTGAQSLATAHSRSNSDAAISTSLFGHPQSASNRAMERRERRRSSSRAPVSL